MDVLSDAAGPEFALVATSLRGVRGYSMCRDDAPKEGSSTAVVFPALTLYPCRLGMPWACGCLHHVPLALEVPCGLRQHLLSRNLFCALALVVSWGVGGVQVLIADSVCVSHPQMLWDAWPKLCRNWSCKEVKLDKSGVFLNPLQPVSAVSQRLMGGRQLPISAEPRVWFRLSVQSCSSQGTSRPRLPCCWIHSRGI